jgi:TRAP-type C4-dicarboxylate transport system substrate-binding protein
MAGILVIANANKWDHYPANVKKVITDQVLAFEKKTMDEITARQAKVKKEMRARGMEPIELKGATAEKYVDTYMETPWGRMRKNPDVKIDVDKLKMAWY